MAAEPHLPHRAHPRTQGSLLARSDLCHHPPARAKLDPAALLQLSRDHWQIENYLFHVRDVTFKEDASRVRSGSASKIMAEIRNAALTMIRRSGHKPRPAREAFAARPRAAIKAVMTASIELP